MRRPLPLAVALLVGCTGAEPDTGDTGPVEEPIVPGTETVSASWDVDLFDPTFESPTIPRFDTLDGRRQLDGMVIAVDHAAVMTVALENGSDFALVADDYSAELYLQSIIQLGATDEDDGSGEGPPFFGPGSFSAVLAADLAAADDTEGAGDDYHVETASDEIQFEAAYDGVETPTYLEAMTGTEDLQLVVGGFSEMWVYWNAYEDGSALLYAAATAIRYSGTMTVTYSYSPAEE
ncbi:MAG: hypothetical protein ACK4YP_00405 [Myxococcota bacterium]